MSSPYLVCPVSTPVLLAYELRSTVLTRPGIDDLHVCLCSFDICNLPRLCSECSPSAQSHLKPASIELVFELVYFSGLEGRSYQADFVPFLTHTFPTSHNVSCLGNKPRILKKMAPPPAIKKPPDLFFSIRFATIFVNLSVGIECSSAPRSCQRNRRIGSLRTSCKLLRLACHLASGPRVTDCWCSGLTSQTISVGGWGWTLGS